MPAHDEQRDDGVRATGADSARSHPRHDETSGRSVAEILATVRGDQAAEGGRVATPHAADEPETPASAEDWAESDTEQPQTSDGIAEAALVGASQTGRSQVARSEVDDSWWRMGLRGIGQTLITLGVVVLLFIVYEAFITGIFNAREQDRLNDQLHDQWAAEEADPSQEVNFADVEVGDAFAVMRVPAFGPDYAQVIVEGTTNEALEKGPGHYEGTAGPGEVGNFSIAGHRVGKGSPFLNVDKLEPGDAIVFETQSYWYVYRVIGNADTGEYSDPAYGDIQGQFVTTPSHYQVISPVPDQEGVEPTQKLVTLTTCHPKFSAAERMIIHGYLDGDPLPKSQYPNPGDVPALNGG